MAGLADSGRPSCKKMTNSDPYAANTGGPANPAREKLVALRLSLLRLHKELLDMERRDYERLHGKVKRANCFDW